jgi:hypothetical protein
MMIAAMRKPLPPKIKNLPPAKQHRLDELLEKSADGTISAKEKERLIALVKEAEQLMIANSERLGKFAQSHSPAPPVNSVPVTVWVNPQLTER